MWDQELYLKTLLFAGNAHQKQFVPGTKISYVVHITNVCMETMHALIRNNIYAYDLNLAMQCALLHDTLEDTEVRYEQLMEMFGQEVAEGVLALTKNINMSKAEAMHDSLARILQQPAEIRIVKMADRINNLQAPPKHWDKLKKQHYLEEAKLILSTLKGVHPFIEERLQYKIEAYNQYIF